MLLFSGDTATTPSPTTKATPSSPPGTCRPKNNARKQRKQERNMRSALQQGIDALTDTMLTIERIDTANASDIAGNKNSVDGTILAARQTQRPRLRQSRQGRKRPQSAAAPGHRRQQFTTFGVGLQRDDSLYNRVVPQSRREPSPREIAASSFRIKHPTRPSSAFSSRSPRACNSLLTKKYSSYVPVSPRLKYHCRVPTADESEPVPTSVSLRDRIEIHKAKRKQHQRPASANTTLMRARRIGDTAADGAPENLNKVATVPRTLSARQSSTGTRRARKPKQRRYASKKGYGNPSKSVVSGTERRRRLAMTKAKYMKSHAHVYLFDDWMQTFVVPKAKLYGGY